MNEIYFYLWLNQLLKNKWIDGESSLDLKLKSDRKWIYIIINYNYWHDNSKSKFICLD